MKTICLVMVCLSCEWWSRAWELRSSCNTLRMATRPKQRNLGRLSEIAQVAVRHGFGYAIDGHKSGDPEAGPTARGRHPRERLAQLGPPVRKFGQVPSARP